MSEAVELCVVCGEAVDETNSALCHGCNRRYHLVLKQGTEGKDCGAVWVDDLSTSLKFACNNCLNEAGVSARVETAGSERRHSAPPSRARRARGTRRYRKR